jgi:hypothetical protein
MSEEVRRVEVITSVQRRRRWSAAEKIRLVEETLEPGMSVSFVARIGRVYLHAVVDTFGSYAFGFLHVPKRVLWGARIMWVFDEVVQHLQEVANRRHPPDHAP